MKVRSGERVKGEKGKEGGVTRGVSAVATGGDKYYVGVEMCGVVRTIFIDTGSEMA